MVMAEVKTRDGDEFAVRLFNMSLAAAKTILHVKLSKKEGAK